MARKKSKQKTSLIQRWRTRWEEADTEGRRRWAMVCLRVGAVMGFVSIAAYGLTRMERTVDTAGTDQTPRIQLVDVPPDIESVMMAALDPFVRQPWSSQSKLCAQIATALKGIGWVREVESVHRYPDRRVEVRCKYRWPAAMVQTADGFFLIDESCVRLPGIYGNDPGLPLIQGVIATPPAAGQAWSGRDISAGLAVTELLGQELFADQISAVLVHNYGGRVDPQAGHLALATDHAGWRIVWGSAPGEEIEENDVEAKLRLLRSNYRRFGRVDANRAWNDISVHPDRIITSR